MRHILSHQVLKGKYSKCIFILQQFDFSFTIVKEKKSLVLEKLLLYLPIVNPNEIAHDPLPHESIYLTDSTDPWYGEIFFYLKAQHFYPELSSGGRHHIHHQARHYLVLNNTLYLCGNDTILLHCLTQQEAKYVLNDSHSRACRGHLSGFATT